MQTGRRTAIAAILSTTLHVAPLALLLLGPRLVLPDLSSPIPITVLPPHPHASPTPVGEPQRGDPRTVEKPKPNAHPGGGIARPHKPRPGPGPKPAPPPPPPPPATADLRPLGPADARIVIVLRTDRLRASPHRENVEALLEALPDYRTLLGGTGLSPIADLDGLFIATSNPYDVTATFLAARHADTPRMHDALTHREMPPGDPRVFRFVAPELSILARPESAARIDEATTRTDAGTPLVDPAAEWLGQLEHFEKLAEAPGGPTVLVTMSDLGSLVRFQAGLPTPTTVSLAATAEASPALRIRLEFANSDEAEAFARGWPGIVQRFKAQLGLLGLGPLVDGLVPKTDGSVLEIAGRLPEPQVRLALSLARALLPPPPVFATPDAASAATDGAGVSDGAATADGGADR